MTLYLKGQIMGGQPDTLADQLWAVRQQRVVSRSWFFLSISLLDWG